jgi:hypothetical protein
MLQAKRYRPDNKIGPAAVRDFFGSLDMFKAAKGLFVTTSSFSAKALQTADMLGKRIVLIDGPQLAQLMIRYNVGCRIEETLHIRKVDKAFLNEVLSYHWSDMLILTTCEQLPLPLLFRVDGVEELSKNTSNADDATNFAILHPLPPHTPIREGREAEINGTRHERPDRDRLFSGTAAPAHSRQVERSGGRDA